MEVALYPFEYMNITQRHDEGNHLAHWKPNANYSDKPWDEACKDKGKSYFTPFNDFKIVEKIGNQKSGCSVRLESVKDLKIPYQKELVKLEITLTHMNQDNFNKVYVGEILKKGTKILMEGTSGQATGNHFHITANIGTYYGFKKNSNGKWVFAYKKSLLPQEAFYVDTTKTKILNSKKYIFVGVNYYKGCESSEVRDINDYMAICVSGRYYGEFTESTIKIFQKQNNLKETGEVNLDTFEKLLDKGANL